MCCSRELWSCFWRQPIAWALLCRTLQGVLWVGLCVPRGDRFSEESPSSSFASQTSTLRFQSLVAAYVAAVLMRATCKSLSSWKTNYVRKPSTWLNKPRRYRVLSPMCIDFRVLCFHYGRRMTSEKNQVSRMPVSCASLIRIERMELNYIIFISGGYS